MGIGRTNAVNVSGGGTDVSDTTATASDVLSGKYFYTANGTKTVGGLVNGLSVYKKGHNSEGRIAKDIWLYGFVDGEGEGGSEEDPYRLTSVFNGEWIGTGLCKCVSNITSGVYAGAKLGVFVWISNTEIEGDPITKLVTSESDFYNGSALRDVYYIIYTGSESDVNITHGYYLYMLEVSATGKSSLEHLLIIPQSAVWSAGQGVYMSSGNQTVTTSPCSWVFQYPYYCAEGVSATGKLYYSGQLNEPSGAKPASWAEGALIANSSSSYTYIAETGDTTATASDVVSGKVFHLANGLCATGTHNCGTIVTQPNPTASVNANTGLVTAMYTPVAGRVTDTAEKSGTLQLSSSNVPTLLPENIKKDVNILGVTGTYEGGGSGGNNTVLLAHFNNSMVCDYPPNTFIRGYSANEMDMGMPTPWNPSFVEGKFGNAVQYPDQSETEEYERSNYSFVFPLACSFFWTENWTLEFWFYSEKANDSNMVCYWIDCESATSDVPLYMTLIGGTDGKLRCGMNDKSYGSNFMTANSVVNSAWNHIAIVCNNNVLKLFLNGVTNDQTYANPGQSASISDGFLRMFNTSNNFHPNGILIDEFRVSKIARYTANFTPSTEPFVVD